MARAITIACLVLVVVLVGLALRGGGRGAVDPRGDGRRGFSGGGGHGRAPLGGGSHLPSGATYEEKGKHELAAIGGAWTRDS